MYTYKGMYTYKEAYIYKVIQWSVQISELFFGLFHVQRHVHL
jgi:hypothetical protein